ncbi:RNA-directed DNA polymerase [Serratia fonticola]|uniref:antiviral reverse transcriptase Drt3a n=1 Tax=Serratia fonticola TaxID=47917 RepID=UPI001AE46FEB|nr:antiviral reverse transcriptase Drt3a [Serratia fonticola]MBP1018242.1 RNA-directed DNA polymerase [Serratia fonticola]CAI1728586.1 Retron-type reverse transcriptase [Serratia fonticola]
MNRQPFTSFALKKKLSDNERYIDLKNNPDEIERLVNDAVNIAHENFRSGVSINKFQLKGRHVYSASCIKEKLVLRHCNSNLKSISNVSLKQRNTIIDEIQIYLREGARFRVYRLDIKSFFESIELDVLLGIINNNTEISRHTKNIVEWYLKSCERKYGSIGLPRGLEISPVLSEIYLSDFDDSLKKRNDIFYYARFVDDIILITAGMEDSGFLLREIGSKLPKGLVLSHRKDKKSISPLIEKRAQGASPNGTIVHKFDYLGYRFSIVDTHIANKKGVKSVYRVVKTDLSDGRLRKIKTRLARAFYSYYKYGNFDLLLDRVSFLTSNRDLKRKIKKTKGIDKSKISTGIYYSNAKLDSDSESLSSLDDFLIFCANSNKGRINKIKNHHINKQQKKALLRNSFKKGFEERIYRKYNFKRYEEITKIWL